MILIGLGSNEGNPANNLHLALDMMPVYGIQVKRCSAFYRTEPWGITDQAVFVNAVAEVSYHGAPLYLLRALLDIEKQMGRIRRFKWGPRLIDLDIIEFHRLQMNTAELDIPHPYYPERDFVLVPLAELEPDWVPTEGRQSVSEIINAQNIPPMALWED